MMRYENTKYNIQNASNTAHCGVSAVYRHDHVADWELRINATAQLHESVIPHIARLGQDQNSKLEVHFLLNVCSFCTLKLKIKNQTI